nr:hypothetical protein [Tanacetum cinerariifolium]
MVEFDIRQEDDKVGALRWFRTASARTLDNREIELNATVDSQDKTIIEASVRRHLELADADGISTLPTTEIFEHLTLMGRASITASSLEIEQGSGNISKTQTKAKPSGSSSLRTSSEGGPREKAQAQKKKGSFDSSEDKEASLDKEDSPKQGRMIEEIDEDENVNLVKSSKQREAHEIARHRMESDDTEVVDFSTASPQKDDDEITLAKTLVNIKKRAIKDKEQAHLLIVEEYAQQVQAQWVSDETRIAQENLAQAEQWDDVQAQIQANEDLVQRMLEEERESLSIE